MFKRRAISAGPEEELRQSNKAPIERRTYASAQWRAQSEILDAPVLVPAGANLKYIAHDLSRARARANAQTANNEQSKHIGARRIENPRCCLHKRPQTCNLDAVGFQWPLALPRVAIEQARSALITCKMKYICLGPCLPAIKSTLAVCTLLLLCASAINKQCPLGLMSKRATSFS